MADRPITFSAPMVQALLAGRKTQTRRVLKPVPAKRSLTPRLETPGYAPGDRLWVREAWRPDPNGCESDGTIGVFYPADKGLLTLSPGEGWKMPKQAQRGKVTPLHMPRWASRTTLSVIEVRVQRLQEISHQDAIHEGVQCHTCAAMHQSACHGKGCPAARATFGTLWNSLHGPDAWDANPWVVAVSFTVERVNIDQARAPDA
jgi:hypothetical protein